MKAILLNEVNFTKSKQYFEVGAIFRSWTTFSWIMI